ncbi:MAG: hypothetical protein ACOY0T_38575 [Myxococcota bacterium]
MNAGIVRRGSHNGATSEARLVVVENGADVRDFEAIGADSEGVHVIGQNRDESPAEFALRVIERLASVERSQLRLERALLLVAPQLDEQRSAARELMARALLTQASVSGSAELVLAVRVDAQAEVRHGLLSLVETLMAEEGAAAVPIKIRFGGQSTPDQSLAPPPKSQVRVRERERVASPRQDVYSFMRGRMARAAQRAARG